MKIVGVELALVEAELLGGLLSCPSCREVLGPWGHARERVTRRVSGDWRWRPRRARCRGCRGTHVLLADLCLLRRQDEVEVIGEAVEAHVAGEGHRPIAARLGVPAGTVRGWLRRYAGRAEVIRAHCSPGVRSCWIRMLGPVCRPGAWSWMRWRRSRLRGGRGCCGSGRCRWVADPSLLVGGRAAVSQHEFPRDRAVVS